MWHEMKSVAAWVRYALLYEIFFMEIDYFVEV